MHLETEIKQEEKLAHSPSNTEEGYGSDEKEMMLEMGSPGAGGVGLKSELKRPDLKGSFRCSICSKVFCHSSSLSRHRMQAHFKSYKCTVCRKDISSSESLRTHMFKQHHISRMYMCRCCNWAFPDKSLLHIHLQTNSTNTNDAVSHGVINRSCHVISDPFQLIRSPLGPLPAAPIPVEQPSPVAASSPIPTSSETSSWLASLPKPIATTTPIFLSPEKSKEDEKSDVYTSQSPTCSSVSFKSDVSAFHQLSTDRHLLASPVASASSPSGSSSSSRISPRHECFDCHVNKTKSTISDNKSKYLEARVATMSQEVLEANAQMNGLEQTVLRLKMEAHVLREHNELFQRKLLECQNLAVQFMQSSENPSDSVEVVTLLRNIINSTILTTPVRL